AFFFFQAEDGIRDFHVTGVQTCALPISFRMRGHEEASGTAYVPSSLLEEWAQRDPIAQFEQVLFTEAGMTPAESEALKSRMREQINNELGDSLADVPPIGVSSERELADVYAPAASNPPEPVARKGDGREPIRCIDAIS